jgi:hypothetical protein
LLFTKTIMRFLLFVVLCIACLVAAPLAAQQNDAVTAVKRDGVCDGFDGLAFAFCVAICEARECHRQPPYDERCATLRSGFDRVTGGQSAPCEAGAAFELTLERL